MFFFSLHLNAKHKRFVYYAYLVSTILGIFTIIAMIVFLASTFLSFIGDPNKACKLYIIKI
jgi:hypothetical protein